MPYDPNAIDAIANASSPSDPAQKQAYRDAIYDFKAQLILLDASQKSVDQAVGEYKGWVTVIDKIVDLVATFLPMIAAQSPAAAGDVTNSLGGLGATKNSTCPTTAALQFAATNILPKLGANLAGLVGGA